MRARASFYGRSRPRIASPHFRPGSCSEVGIPGLLAVEWRGGAPVGRGAPAAVAAQFRGHETAQGQVFAEAEQDVPGQDLAVTTGIGDDDAAARDAEHLDVPIEKARVAQRYIGELRGRDNGKLGHAVAALQR